MRSVLRNCPNCGRLLTSSPGTPCPYCAAEDDVVVEAITAHLAAEGDHSLSGVVAATGVPAKVVRRLVESGRIALGMDGNAVNCVLCGAPLRGSPGKVCAVCAAKVQAARRSAVRSTRPAPQPPTDSSDRRGYHSRPARPGS